MTTPKPLALADALLDGMSDEYWNQLSADAAALLRTQHAEIERLNDDLAFVERWANHHGAKPHTTPQEALSVIQHYPPIKAITRSYKDGVVPDTFDPYAAIERKDALLRQARLHVASNIAMTSGDSKAEDLYDAITKELSQ